MANRAYLINSTSLTSDPAELEQLRNSHGHVDGEVAESSNRLLIPWFLCFRESDLRPVRNRNFRLPCTTVAQAARNLEQSLPIFEAIAGDPTLAKQYWTLSCTLLRRLPLPYLTMDPTEVFLLGDEPSDESIAAALSGNLTAVPHLISLSGYNQEVQPYPLDVLYSMPEGEANEARTYNSSVLDGGFQSDFKYVMWNTTSGAAAPHTPQPPPDSVFGELRDVSRLIEGWVKTEVPSAAGAGLGIWVGNPELLEVNVYASSVADAKSLESNAQLRGKLDDLAGGRLQPWCTKYGFAWSGFRFSAPKWAQDSRLPHVRVETPAASASPECARSENSNREEGGRKPKRLKGWLIAFAVFILVLIMFLSLQFL